MGIRVTKQVKRETKSQQKTTEIHFGKNMLNYTNIMGFLNTNLSRSSDQKRRADELCGEQSKCTYINTCVYINCLAKYSLNTATSK
jgi:hypothetical protein